MSPFVKLPTATTLPYTYRTMPSALPPSTTGIGVVPADGEADSSAAKPKYVVSTSGHAAHPDDIIASCRALQAHIAKMQSEAEADLRALDERIRARELAEKRRVAPGWLDSDARLLEPEKKSAGDVAVAAAAIASEQSNSSRHIKHVTGGASEMAVPDEGAELDRAFGIMNLGQGS